MKSRVAAFRAGLKSAPLSRRSRVLRSGAATARRPYRDPVGFAIYSTDRGSKGGPEDAFGETRTDGPTMSGLPIIDS